MKIFARKLQRFFRGGLTSSVFSLQGLLAGILVSSATPALALTGFTYTGRILDGNNAPVESSEVYFTTTIYDENTRCWLYTEIRKVDLSQSSGTFSLNIGSNESDLVAGSASFNSNVTTLSDVFNNSKTFNGLTGCLSGSNSYAPSSSTAPRSMSIYFRVGSGPQQALPVLKINPVPSALQAYEVDGYGSGALLKLASTVDPNLNSNPNNGLDQTQYDEFWRLVKNPLSAYLPPSGDVTVVSGNNKVTSLLGQTLPAGPATSGQVLVSNGTAWVLQSMSSGSVTSVSANAPLSVGGTASAPVISLPAATTSTDGYLKSADWNTFNSKQSSSLANGNVWIGNGSGVAEAQSVSGDATLAANGTLTLATTTTAATKGTAQKVPQITYDAKGRITSVTEVTIDDTTKLPLAGGTMTGALNMGSKDITNTGNITMAANKYLGLSANSTDGTVAGQMWYDSGTIKYYDGASVKSLGVAGAGITNFNGSTAGSQSLAVPGTSGTAPNWSTNTGTGVHTLNIPMASTATVTAGLLSKTDYDRIGKSESLNGKAFDTTAASTMGQILYFDSAADKWKVSTAAAPTDGQVMKWNDTSKAWEPGTDSAGWTAVDASYAAKGIVQFQTDAATSGINVASGVATVVRTTTGQSSTILSLDGSGIANMYAAGIKGATSGTVTLQAPTTTANYSLTLPNVAPAAGQSLQSDALGNLSWVSALGAVSDTATLTSGKIWVGNASNKSSEVSVSGDATLASNGTLTLATTTTAATSGTAQKVPQITYDAKGRITSVTEVTIDDNTKLPLAGGTMTGPIAMGAQDLTNAGNITMAANKYLGLSANSTDGTVAGQMWYDAGTIKYYDGTSVKSLGVAGAGITNFNGSTVGSQSLATPGTSGNAPNWSTNTGTGVHTLNIPMASSGASVTAGLLSNSEYATLSAKQSSSLTSAKVWVGNASGVAQEQTLSGDIASVSNTGSVTIDKTQSAQASKILQLDASSVAVTKGVNIGGAGSGVASLRYPNTATNTTLTLPSSAGSANQVLQTDGAGLLTWATVLSSITDTASLTSGKIWVGNASNKSSEVSVSGDATLASDGTLTLATTTTAATKGTAQKVPQVTYDAKGRITSITEVTIDDNTKLPLVGGTMTGPIAMGAQDLTNTGNITMAANKYLTLSDNATAGSVAGQIWYNAGKVYYWNGSSAVELGVAGAGITSLNGLTAGTQTFAVGTSGNAPAFSSNTSTHTLNIPMASSGASVTAGLLSNAEYAALNAKQTSSLSSAKVWVGNASGVAQEQTLSGDIASVSNAGSVTVDKTTLGQSSKILALDGSGVANMYGAGIKGATSGTVTLQSTATTANYSLTFPAAQGGANQTLSNDGSGNLSWASALTAITNTATLTSGKIWVGNASNKAMEATMGGDATLASDGTLTLATTTTAATSGTAQKVPQVTYDAKGRITSVTEVTIDDNTKLPLAGGTMTGALNMGGKDITNTGNISMAANKYLTLSDNATPGSVAGQIWYNGGKVYYWNGSSAVELGVAGAGITSLNGLTAGTQTFAIGTSGNAPAFSSSTSTHTLNIPMASSGASVTAGLLSNAEYTTLNAKQSSSLTSAKVWVGNASGVAQEQTLSGDIASVSNTGSVTIDKTQSAQASKILQLDASSVAVTKGVNVGGAGSGVASLRYPNTATNTTLTLPSSAGSANQVLQTDGAGLLSWTTVLSTITGTASLTSGKIWVGNASNKSAEVSVSGDATLASDGTLTLATTTTAATKGTAQNVPQITYDAKGRITSVTEVAIDDNTKLPKSGGTMTGPIAMGAQDITNTGNITMAANKYFTLSANTTNGTAAGQMWYDSGTIKYYDGTTVKSLNVVGNGITSLNGLTAATQTFAIGTSGNAPAFSSSTSTHTLNIPLASAGASVTAGLLSNAEYAALNAKQTSSLTAAKIWVGNASGVAQEQTLSGDIASVSNTGSITVDKTALGQSSKILALDGSGVANMYGAGIKGATSGTVTLQSSATTANYSLTLPAAQGAANQVLANNGSGALSWASVLTGVNNIASLTSSKIWVGNASNLAVETDPSTLFLMRDGSVAMTGSLKMGGNKIYGNSTAGGDLTIDSTSDASKGSIILQPVSGNVGVGATNPASARLQVYSTSTLPMLVQQALSSGNNKQVAIFKRSRSDTTAPVADFGGSLDLQLEGFSDGSGIGAGSLVWAWDKDQTNDTTDRDAYFAIQTMQDNVLSERLRIVASGNIGIGTTTPTELLSLKSTSQSVVKVESTSTSGTAQVSFLRGTAETSFGPDATSIDLWSSENLPFIVTLDGTNEVFRIKPTGNVGIGTSTPNYKLQVAGVIAPTGDGTYDLGASTSRFKNIYASNGTIQTSDARQKTNIETSDLGLDFINSLRPVSYYWKNGDQNLHYGVIAQETEKALSEAKKRLGKNASVDNTIVTHDQETDAYGVRYTELIAPLIKALQEMYHDFVDTKETVKKQEREIASVKAELEKSKKENAEIRAWICSKDPGSPFCRKAQ